jgi:hypothetical protein
MEIQDYQNYLIYPDGRVYNKKHNRFLKPHLTNHGYLQIDLSNNGKHKVMKVHRLIANHYIPNPENKPCVDHIDRDRQNNNIENLRWVTIRENSSNRTDQNDYIGVRKSGSRFQAKIKIDGKSKLLGTYDTQEEASNAYRKALDEHNNGLHISYKKPPPKCGYKGVYQNHNRYQAQLTIDGKQKYIGLYDTADLARDAIMDYKNKYNK